jgi:hypothetical protein
MEFVLELIKIMGSAVILYVLIERRLSVLETKMDFIIDDPEYFRHRDKKS